VPPSAIGAFDAVTVNGAPAMIIVKLWFVTWAPLDIDMANA
jgi:hypothetical protein